MFIPKLVCIGQKPSVKGTSNEWACPGGHLGRIDT